MAQVSLPYTLQAGQPENVNNLVANLNALVAGVNTVDTAQLASGSVTTAKLASAVGNFGAWTSFTPGLSSAGGGLDQGSTGAKYGVYAKIGKVVHARLYLTFAGTGINAGTGQYQFTLPVAHNGTYGRNLGYFWAYDSSSSNFAMGVVDNVTSTSAYLIYGATYLGATTQVASNAPWVWNSGDELVINLMYEAA